MPDSKRTVLITGCSDNSLGSALAHAFHNNGFHVFATARDVSKMQSSKEAGIESFELDVQSDDSIKAAIEKVSATTGGSLDILVNNAGGGHYQPFLHLDLKAARNLFEVNVWPYLAVTQAFLPLLMKSAEPSPKGKHSLIINNTSISSVLRKPYHSAYGASKAAMAAFNDAQRIELSPFGIRVVDLKTGSLSSNFKDNKTNLFELPADSPYQPIKDEVLKVITGDVTESYAEDQTGWAKNVVSDLMKDIDNPPAQIWRGGSAGTIRASTALDGVIPANAGDGQFQKLGGLDKLEKILVEKAKNSGTS